MQMKDKKVDQICIPKNHDGLLQAARQILRPETASPILEGIDARKKWITIQREYALLRSRGVTGDEAIKNLSERYFYSEKTIESIIYTR